MKLTRLIRTFVPLFLLAIMATGCSSRPSMGQYTYRVVLDDALRDANSNIMPSIEVDFVGVNEAEQDRWKGQNLDEYFTPGNVVRANSTRFTMPFTNENSRPQTLAANNAIWQQWSGSGAREMFIMASIPITGDSMAVDPRRLVLTLDKARWNGTNIEIHIKPSGVVCQTPMRPLKTR